MSAVVITGAAGDLGRALSASFLADGYTRASAPTSRRSSRASA